MGTNATLRAIIASFALCLAGCSDDAPTNSQHVKANDWLLKAGTDEERFRLIQRQMRGFDQPMWEVGERYTRMHEALKRGNPDLAAYHWEKIRTTIENGFAKRPARRANAEALFLTPVWTGVDNELKSGDPARAWRGFERAKAACQACHVAEKVGYMNNQEVFDLAVPTGAGE